MNRGFTVLLVPMISAALLYASGCEGWSPGSAPAGMETASLTSATAPRREPPRPAIGLSDRTVQAVIDHHQSELSRCAASNAPERVNVDLTIDAEGYVTAVRAAGSRSALLPACVENTIEAWRFPARPTATRAIVPVHL